VFILESPSLRAVSLFLFIVWLCPPPFSTERTRTKEDLGRPGRLPACECPKKKLCNSLMGNALSSPPRHQQIPSPFFSPPGIHRILPLIVFHTLCVWLLINLLFFYSLFQDPEYDNVPFCDRRLAAALTAGRKDVNLFFSFKQFSPGTLFQFLSHPSLIGGARFG